MSRAYLRGSERADLQVRVDFELDDMTYAGVTRNISAGGVFVATEELPPVGARINLKFTLPGSDRQLAVETEVRWTRPRSEAVGAEGAPGMGLRFLAPSESDVAELEKFLARRDALMREED